MISTTGTWYPVPGKYFMAHVKRYHGQRHEFEGPDVRHRFRYVLIAAWVLSLGIAVEHAMGDSAPVEIRTSACFEPR